MPAKVNDRQMPFLAQPPHDAFVDAHLLREESPMHDRNRVELDQLDGFGHVDHYSPLLTTIWINEQFLFI